MGVRLRAPLDNAAVAIPAMGNGQVLHVAHAGGFNQTNTRASNPEQSIATPASATARKPSEANSSRKKVFGGAVPQPGLSFRLNHSARSAVRRWWAAIKTSVDALFDKFHMA